MHAPFIPAWLDDAGLTPIQFRVLAHLHRRAGKRGRCWPGSTSIAKACRISEDSLWPAVKSLEERGFLRREKRRYNSNEYVLLSRSDVTPSNPVTLSPPETGEQSPESRVCESPAQTGERSLECGGCKVSSWKVQNEVTTKKGVGPHTLSSWPSSLSDRTTAELEIKLRAKPEVLANAYAAFRAAKLTYRDPAPATEADAIAIFEVWFTTSRSAKRFRVIGGDWEDAKRRFNGILEPKGWREFVAHKYGATPATDGKQWGELDEVQQRQINNAIAADQRQRRAGFADPRPWDTAA
jgi:DNA-binding Lrp family transcriptional regulator